MAVNFLKILLVWSWHQKAFLSCRPSCCSVLCDTEHQFHSSTKAIFSGRLTVLCCRNVLPGSWTFPCLSSRSNQALTGQSWPGTYPRCQKDLSQGLFNIYDGFLPSAQKVTETFLYALWEGLPRAWLDVRPSLGYHNGLLQLLWNCGSSSEKYDGKVNE